MKILSFIMVVGFALKISQFKVDKVVMFWSTLFFTGGGICFEGRGFVDRSS